MPRSERSAILLSWSVHLLTASGAVLGVFALVYIARERLEIASLLILGAFVIDAVDGTFARALRVSEHLPWFDGRKLDDIVDFQNYTIVPVFFMWGADSLVHPLWLVAPTLASAYGFSRVDAKTADDYFLGFPSYWNIVAIYLWLLEVDRFASTLWVAGLSIAVFVPIKYLYPSKVEPRSFRAALAIGGLLWLLVLVVCIGWPDAAGHLLLAELSLVYPVWYLWLSFTRGGLARDVRL